MELLPVRPPFPGMDPYLEQPALWSEVHSRLIVAIADNISEQLLDDYRVAIEKRIYLSEPDESLLIGIPDISVVASRTVTLPVPEEVQERYLEIRDVSSGTVVTAIELLSPTNKRPGEGLIAYQKQRRQVLASLIHLVEIDLLRGGQPLPVKQEVKTGDYSILVSRSDQRPLAELYEFGLRQSIPAFALPLKPLDGSIVVDLQTLIEGVYRRAKYYLAIDYSKPPNPHFSLQDAAWARKMMKPEK